MVLTYGWPAGTVCDCPWNFWPIIFGVPVVSGSEIPQVDGSEIPQVDGSEIPQVDGSEIPQVDSGPN
jgi:hypothetical protein